MTDTSSNTNKPSFGDLGLSESILKVLDSIGYETPSPIQEQCISLLLNGEDIIGQAQTGTGKTAAFALPLLDKINIKKNHVQLLILTPTRELAIQVSEAVQTYARGMKGFHVLPIYGGQSYDIQLRPLKRGVHAVVGTPGRVMDHIKRGTLKLDGLNSFVLDEADEMLKMGFIDDIKWVMERIPESRQIALFSATMPHAIKKVAEDFLNKPKIVKIKTKTETATNITQKYWLVGGVQKLDALTRILEVTKFDAMIIFVRTKTLTVELAEKLSARGFSAEAINGDIQQSQRERIINGFKKGKTDILIATDVAARGLDVERISHVVNYDIPQDAESYVHRIGRTGRAGRSGEAILFVSHRERRMLSTIERVTRQKIEPIELPSAKMINEQRIDSFKQRISETISNQDLTVFEKLVGEFISANAETDTLKISAALALIAQGSEPLLLSEKDTRFDNNKDRKTTEKIISTKAEPLKNHPQIPMRRYKIEVGNNNNVNPGNILGAIANEADMDSEYIGSIQIFDNFSTIDLPDEMPNEVFELLGKTVVCGKKLNIAQLTEKNNSAIIVNKNRKKSFDSGKYSRKGSNDRRSRKNRADSQGTRRGKKPKFSRSSAK
jgi:ATP-dependent RNA helicase DeaD